MKTKICTKCGIEKSISEFYKNKKNKDRLQHWCKKCFYNLYHIKNNNRIKKYYKENSQKFINKYNNYYKKFPEKLILWSIKQRCNNSNYNDFKYYGKKGIKCLITAKEIKQLMIRDNYWNLNRPSIDRISSNGHYELNNCRFIELSENSSRASRKTIQQMDLNGNVIKEFKSAIEASLKFNCDQKLIATSARCIQATGSFWRYKNV